METLRSTRGRNLSPVQKASAIVGAAFLLVGFAGFIPGVTTGYGDLAMLGHESHAHLLGLFQVSVLHNVVHILFGVAGLALARTAKTARGFLLGSGAIYLFLVVYGLFVDSASGANFVPLNAADNWLHLFLGAGMVIMGLALPAHRHEMMTQ